MRPQYWPSPLQVGTLAPRPRGRESLGHALLLQLLPLSLPLSEDLAGQGIRELLQNKAAVGLPSYVSRICCVLRFGDANNKQCVLSKTIC